MADAQTDHLAEAQRIPTRTPSRPCRIELRIRPKDREYLLHLMSTLALVSIAQSLKSISRKQLPLDKS